MKTLRCSISLIIALLTCGASMALAEQPADPDVTLRAGYINFPPLTYTDTDGQPAGAVIDLSNALAAEAGYQLE